MLKDYPELIERLQEVLDSVVEKPSRGTAQFERALWKLEGRLTTFLNEARSELEAAKASSDPDAVIRSNQKLDLVEQANWVNHWIADEAMRNFFRRGSS
ncbi:hypothetical protein [uncultured Stenotrophomonas sp.]|uniref:hypothetical protein n=1 Tax=uncultured Stenotrophomonas sp. TaxID=165438 RepID=UPI0025E9E3EA|nr:hypothetical protein [uncultured Stenotrophomonas sp.]